MPWLPRIFCLLILAAAPGRAEELAARVVVLANRDDPESMEVAQHYLQARNVPAENLIALPMPRAETITWQEFIPAIWEPLRARLVQARWIDAVAMKEPDAIGRTKYAVMGHRIAYLVVCRGVPLRIMHDPKLYAPVPPMTNTQAFRTNAGAVDAELGLLAYQVTPVNPTAPDPNHPITAFIPNPLFGNDHPTYFDLTQVVKVSRLDGLTVADANALVDRALAVERQGLTGRAYIDLCGRDPAGDRWLEHAGTRLRENAWDVDTDRAEPTFPATARFDAPALYFGWYAHQTTGPFALPGFQLAPGAVAVHIFSFSAETMRGSDRNWSAYFVARGAGATVGNVFEPYLQLTHRPDFLVAALLRGETWGDAACYALPALSWQAIAIGDPLYRPWAVALEAQLKNRAQLPPRLAGYAVVRRMNELEAQHRGEEAIALARSVQRDEPSLAVGLALAQRLQQAGDKAGAAAALGFLPLLTAFRPAEAMCTFQNLLRNRNVPRELRLAWLPEAERIAREALDEKQAAAWSQERVEMGMGK